MDQILVGLLGASPAAVAAIVMAVIFLKRARESQELGHKTAQNMADTFSNSLKEQVVSHERAMTRISTSIDRTSETTADLTKAVTEHLATLKAKQ